jgi:hypothetical protein
VHVALVQVFGVTVNRVTSLADSGSSYRIQAGGGVAVVRGTSFALGVMAPFAALGCATGSVAMDIVSCEPGQLLVWEFDQETGTRASAFQEKSIPAGNLGAALNAVVSAIGELASGQLLSSQEENEDGVTANNGNTPSGGSGCGGGDGDKGNSEEAHGAVTSRDPGSRGECVSAAAHDNNAARLNAGADALEGLDSDGEHGNSGNNGKHLGSENGKSSAAKEGNGKSD